MFQELGDKSCTATTPSDFGLVVQHAGDVARAEALQRESLGRYRDLGDRPGMARSFERLAGAIAASGEPQRAARLLGAARALRQAIGVEPALADRLECERIEAAVRGALGADAFTAAWDEGRTMTLTRAIEDALAV